MKEQFSKFEKDIVRSFAAPNASEALKNQLKAAIKPVSQSGFRKPLPQRKPKTRLSLGWSLTAALSLVALVVVLAVGPGKVWAQIQKTFAFLPGFGLVEKDTPIRTIAEPVSQSQENISIDVVNALLTSTETKIDYRVFGLGKTNFGDETDPDCREQPKLVLPDGSELIKQGNSFPPVPAEVDQAVLVIPCIQGTITETTPGNWQLHLTFTAAENPEELLAVEFIPQPILSVTSSGEDDTAEPEALVRMGLGTAIETADGYILTGYLDSEHQSSYLAIDPKITDAKGQIVQTTYPAELMQLAQNEPLLGKADIFALAFKNRSLQFPLTVTWDYYPITEHRLASTPEQSFDAGENPQPGQVWNPNLSIDVEGITLTLKEITVERGNSYRFTFEGPGNLAGVSVEMPDYDSIGGGGGASGYPNPDGSKEAHVSIAFANLPTGRLSFHVTGVSLYADAVSLSQTWEPSTPHAQTPVQTSSAGTCMVGSMSSDIAALETFEEELHVLAYAPIPGTDEWSTTLLSNKGASPNSAFTASNIAWFTRDGKQIMLPAQENGSYVLQFCDIASSQTTSIPVSGTDISLSPDGKYLAMTLTDDMVHYPAYYEFETGLVKPISADEYVSIAGWSPDSQTVYYTARYTEGLAWKVLAYSFETGEKQKMFDITNGTIKLLYPRISPDGKWLSYRGTDNSSVWLMNLETQENRLLMDGSNARSVIWLDDARLVASLTDENGSYHLVVVDINDCGISRVDGIQTELMDAILVK